MWPFWFRPSFADTLAPAGTATGGPGGVGLARLPSTAASVASLAVLGLLLVAAFAVAWRRRDRTAATAPVFALVGLAVGYYTANHIPIEVFGVAAHNFRWLWPLAAFSAFALLAVIVRRVTGVPEAAVASDATGETRETGVVAPMPPRSRAIAGVGIGLVGLLVVLTIPTYNAGVGPNLNLWAEPVLRDIDRQIDARPPRGPLLTDFSNAFFLEPFSTPLLAQLQRSGVKFVTDDETQVRQVGPARRYDGHNARGRIAYRQGDSATAIPPGWRRIAFHAGLDARDRRELERLRAAKVLSARRTELEDRWNRTVAVYVLPLHGPSSAATP
jgi:LPXTG-motif cell wall-anchored protein